MNWQGILIHHSAARDGEGVDVQAYRRFHVEERGWRDLGYHFVCEVIDGSVEVVAGRPLNMSGAHCRGRNSTHLGFCFAGDFTEAGPPLPVLTEAAQHLAGLCDALDIPTSSIERHCDYWPTACPGKAFDVEGLRQLVDRFRE